MTICVFPEVFQSMETWKWLWKVMDVEAAHTTMWSTWSTSRLLWRCQHHGVVRWRSIWRLLREHGLPFWHVGCGTQQPRASTTGRLWRRTTGESLQLGRGDSKCATGPACVRALLQAIDMDDVNNSHCTFWFHFSSQSLSPKELHILSETPWIPVSLSLELHC